MQSNNEMNETEEKIAKNLLSINGLVTPSNYISAMRKDLKQS